MQRRAGCLGAAFAGVALSVVGVGVALPLIVTGMAGAPWHLSANGCGHLVSETDGEDAPSILGRTTLSTAELVAWWDSTGRGQPSALAQPLEDVIALYVREADAEGVRGDLALAQAIHETGYFASSDVARNNFAGIAHYDGAGSGQSFADVRTGIRAHIQLLKKYAAGNDAQLAHPDVAPNAGARASTWSALAGSWATAPNYWTALSQLYDLMLRHADRTEIVGPYADLGLCTAGDPQGDVELTTVRGIEVHVALADQVEDLLAAAEADGLDLSGWGYRSTEEQIDLRRQHCGTSHYAVYEMPSSQCSPPTARPGTSMHEQGLAIDFQNCSSRSTACFQWLSANAATYGLYNLPSEPWHWSTSGA